MKRFHRAPPAPYVGIDGTAVSMSTAEAAGQPAQHTSGSASTRELKPGTGWSAEGRDREGL